MSEDCGLFNLPEGWEPPPPPERLGRQAQYHRRVARRIGQGYHPLGEPLRLHPDAPRDLDSEEARRSDATGPRCGSCRFRERQGKWPKCVFPTTMGDRQLQLRNTGGESSDIAAWWPACTDYRLDPQRRGCKT